VTAVQHTNNLPFRSTALGSAICAGAAINLFGWDLTKPESLSDVNTKGNVEFTAHTTEEARQIKWEKWQLAVERSRKWEQGDIGKA
jgi:glycerol kinase